MAHSPAAGHAAASARCRPGACTCTCPGACSKCPYCDFNSHDAPNGQLPQARYVDALLADLEAALPLVWGRPVVQRLHRRRHAQPVLAGRDRRNC
jgi:hypothetical protein